MADTEISVFKISPFSINNIGETTEYAVKASNITSSNIFYENSIGLTSNKFDIKQINFNNEISLLKSVEYQSQDTGSNQQKTTTYLMRARKNSDNSFVYWRATTIDYAATGSGFQLNAIKELCVVSYD